MAVQGTAKSLHRIMGAFKYHIQVYVAIYETFFTPVAELLELGKVPGRSAKLPFEVIWPNFDLNLVWFYVFFNSNHLLWFSNGVARPTPASLAGAPGTAIQLWALIAVSNTFSQSMCSFISPSLHSLQNAANSESSWGSLPRVLSKSQGLISSSIRCGSNSLDDFYHLRCFYLMGWF